MFRRKPISDDSPPPPDALSPGQVSWNYDRAEIIADGVVHAAGVVLGLIGAVAIVIVALRSRPVAIAPTLIYMIGLVAMLGLSAAYNK
jgi:hemolysin III